MSSAKKEKRREGERNIKKRREALKFEFFKFPVSKQILPFTYLSIDLSIYLHRNGIKEWDSNDNKASYRGRFVVIDEDRDQSVSHDMHSGSATSTIHEPVMLLTRIINWMMRSDRINAMTALSTKNKSILSNMMSNYDRF